MKITGPFMCCAQNMPKKPQSLTYWINENLLIMQDMQRTLFLYFIITFSSEDSMFSNVLQSFVWEGPRELCTTFDLHPSTYTETKAKTGFYIKHNNTALSFAVK